MAFGESATFAFLHPVLGIGGAERLVVDAASSLSFFCDLVAHTILPLELLCHSKVVFYCHFPDRLLAPHGNWSSSRCGGDLEGIMLDVRNRAREY